MTPNQLTIQELDYYCRMDNTTITPNGIMIRATPTTTQKATIWKLTKKDHYRVK